MAYEHVNAEWPCASNDLPPLHYKEAITATKRLYRLTFKRRCPWKFKPTSGRRYGGMDRPGVWFINPDRGWWILVHNLSHHFSRRLHPTAAPHSTQHAFLERTLIAHVVKAGWLAGRLQRPAVDRPPQDRRAIRAARIAARLKAWEGKRRRADRAIAGLRRKAAYYAKAGFPAAGATA